MKAYSVHDRKWFKYHWHWYASKLNFTLYPFWKLIHPFVKYIKTQPKCSKYFALKWYLSCACREVGYCQGSAFIVGLLLMQVAQFFISYSLFNLLNCFKGEWNFVDWSLVVKLREREGQRVDLGRSLKGHLWMVDGGWWYTFPWCFTLNLVATHLPSFLPPEVS